MYIVILCSNAHPSSNSIQETLLDFMPHDCGSEWLGEGVTGKSSDSVRTQVRTGQQKGKAMCKHAQAKTQAHMCVQESLLKTDVCVRCIQCSERVRK